MSAPATVIAAYEASLDRIRAVGTLDDGRIGLFERKRNDEAPAKPLFKPQSLIECRRFAELVIAGNAAAISHPRGNLLLAAALVAVLETIDGGTKE